VTLPGTYVIADAGAFVLVALFTEVLRRIALRHRLMDWPGHGKAHRGPTPYLGGVAIVVGTLAAAVVAAPPRDLRVLTLIVAGAVIAVLGLVDDIRPLGVTVRLVTEGLAAALVVASGTRADIFGHLPVIGRWPDIVITLLWIVLMTNSFNLLDNSDGAAGGVAMVTGAALAVLAFGTGWESIGILQLALSAGCAGFLVHNWAPARIFMGDAGSLFLGFVISVSAVLVFSSPGSAAAGTSGIARVCGLLLLTFVAVVDTCTVMVSRHRAGLPLVRGGTDHAAHRLRVLGLGTSQAAVLLSGGAGLSCTCGLLVTFGVVPAVGSLAVTLALGTALVVLAQRVRGTAPATAPTPAPPPASQTSARAATQPSRPSPPPRRTPVTGR
jgi:UDP-GlcNAc:undecaprenyl-phosphate/decaprenyl-phosphate GlcNAc-1-phosphate transferase